MEEEILDEMEESEKAAEEANEENKDLNGESTADDDESDEGVSIAKKNTDFDGLWALLCEITKPYDYSI